MSMPPGPESSDGMVAVVAAQVGQVLAKQGEMAVQLGIISEQLRPVADHELRIRANETAITQLQAQRSGSRDAWARVLSVAAVVAAAAATVADYLHH